MILGSKMVPLQHVTLSRVIFQAAEPPVLYW